MPNPKVTMTIRIGQHVKDACGRDAKKQDTTPSKRAGEILTHHYFPKTKRNRGAK